jgi:hypothetical protein
MTKQVFRTQGFGSAQSQSLGKPAARFPGAVATDSDLAIAVDRQQTLLATTLDSVSTTMTVTDPSSITAYNLLSIDSEIVKVTGPPAGGVVPIQRGFDGTGPATHLAGAMVWGFIDAWHHNALVSEVEAIESALGPHLSRIPGSPFIPIQPYNFQPIAPGGNLIAGANVITLAPVPLGVNGSDANHWLYVQGGTGAAEAVQIIGGTAVSGAASGTIIANCANSHTGAWTIQSASAGLMEAWTANGGVGCFLFPAGISLLYYPVTLLGNISLHGMGQGASIVKTAGGLTGDWLYLKSLTDSSSPYVDIGDFTLIDNTATFHTAGSMIRIAGKSLGQVSNIEIERGWDGIIYDNCPGSIASFALHIGCARHAIYISTFGGNYPSVAASGGIFSSCYLASSTSNSSCIQIEGPTTTIEFSCVSAQCIPSTPGNVCLQFDSTSVNPSGECTFTGCIFDAAGKGVAITGDSSGYTIGWLIFDGCEINATEAGLYITGNVQNVYWNGGLIKASGGTSNTPVYIGNGVGVPKNIQIRSTSLSGTGTWAFNFDVVSNIQIQNCPVGLEGTGPTTFLVISNSPNSVVVENCNMAACTAGKITSTGGTLSAVRVTDFSNSWKVADLLALANGSTVMCSDGTAANPVAAGGTGCLAKRLNGVWVGN